MILRSYNGKRGSMKHMDSIYVNIHSAIALYSQSFVLSKDERYTNINEVFMDCVINKKIGKIDSSPHQSGIAIADDVDWRVLINDSICICRNKRMVLRVLFDTLDLLNHGSKSIKKMESKNLTREFVDFFGESHHVTIKKKEIKLAKKKVEYCLSWTASNWDFVGSDIVDDIKTWMDDWILKEEDRMNMNTATIMGSITNTKGTPRQYTSKLHCPIKVDGGPLDAAIRQSEPLLRVVSEKKKDKPNLT